MWYAWTAILVSCALVASEAPAPATTRAPLRTLDRQAAELAWRSWLQSPESGNQNAPPRRITTKSLFITPLVCPKGQRLDSNGCVQVVTVNKDEHERILLEQLNALFTSAPSGDVIYDYGDEEPGPLQLSIPIALDPQAAPLQAQEPTAQAQDLQPSYVKLDKKGEIKIDDAAGLVAELELLQLQHSQNSANDTTSAEASDILNHNVLSAADKLKRDSPANNATDAETLDSDEGEKEVVYGHVNIDPVVYGTEINTEQSTTEVNTETTTEIPMENATVPNTTADESEQTTITTIVEISNETRVAINNTKMLTKEPDRTKLNPENDYADIGEAIKLISRYAEVTTDDNFSKLHHKSDTKDDSILGTRTKLQYRKNKTKVADVSQESRPVAVARQPAEYIKEKWSTHNPYFKKDAFYRYPWQDQHSQTPPPDYPFRNIQDYWPDRNQIGGVYNTAHGNPRRHHHSFPHNYFRPHNMPYGNYPGQAPYLGPSGPFPRSNQPYTHRVLQHRARPMRSHTNNQDLYTLLGLRHWFSSEGTSKR